MECKSFLKNSEQVAFEALEILEKERNKCGEIFILHEGDFDFGCTLCNESFQQIEDFIKHVRGHYPKKCYSQNTEQFYDKNHYEICKLEKDTDEDFDTVLESNDLELLGTSPTVEDIKTESAAPIETVFVSENKNDDVENEEHSFEEKKIKRPRRIRGNIADKICCELCKKLFSTAELFEQHEAGCRAYYQHLENLKTYQLAEGKTSELHDPKVCRFCNRRCKNRTDCLEHECLHTGEKLFECEKCVMYFRTKSLLRHHKQFHDNEKKYKCNLCDVAFRLHSNLIVHSRRHTGEKRYKCSYCDKCFVSSSERTAHERSHTGEKPFQCDDCGKCFKTKGFLNIHAAIHANEKIFECNVCNKSFVTRGRLQNHAVIHTGIKKYKCQICNASFAKSCALKSHEKIHLDKKEYACTICGKSFNQAPGLHSHMKTHGTINEKN